MAGGNLVGDMVNCKMPYRLGVVIVMADLYIGGVDQKLITFVNQMVFYRAGFVTTRDALASEQKSFLNWLLLDRPFRKKRLQELIVLCSNLVTEYKYKSEVTAALIAGLHDEELKIIIIEQRDQLLCDFEKIRALTRHPKSHEALIIIDLFLTHLRATKIN